MASNQRFKYPAQLFAAPGQAEARAREVARLAEARAQEVARLRAEAGDAQRRADSWRAWRADQRDRTAIRQTRPQPASPRATQSHALDAIQPTSTRWHEVKPIYLREEWSPPASDSYVQLQEHYRHCYDGRAHLEDRKLENFGEEAVEDRDHIALLTRHLATLTDRLVYMQGGSHMRPMSPGHQ